MYKKVQVPDDIIQMVKDTKANLSPWWATKEVIEAYYKDVLGRDGANLERAVTAALRCGGCRTFVKNQWNRILKQHSNE